jgi:predicted RNase H-like HicB family nuclease
MRGKLETETRPREHAFKPCFSGANAENYRMNLAVKTEQETDGRWIAEIPQIPGVLAYGATRDEAISRVKALALRVLADRLELGEMPRELEEVFSVAI